MSSSITSRSRDERKALKICIDFGTTYSAVSYAHYDLAGDSGELPRLAVGEFHLSRLQYVHFTSQSQVRTQLAWYKNDWIWGDEVDAAIRRDPGFGEKNRITLLKLGLLENEQTETIRSKHMTQLQALKVSMAKSGKETESLTTFDLVREYLRRLYAYAKKKIHKRYGELGIEDVFDKFNISCAICVPALWDDHEEIKDGMIRAVGEAGLPNPDLISEPEAAAAFVIQQEWEQNQNFSASPINRASLFHNNKPFLVADIGGGTADLITYILESRTPALRMKEGNSGSGGLYGSAILNQEFRAFLAEEKHREIEEILVSFGKRADRPKFEQILDLAERGFEDEKRTWGGHEPMRIPISSESSSSSRPGFIQVEPYVSSLFLDSGKHTRHRLLVNFFYCLIPSRTDAS